MNDDRIEQLEARIRELEERLEGLVRDEHGVVHELNKLRDDHDELKASFEKVMESWLKWESDHEGRHQEINDHLYPVFFKLFPEQEGLLPEIDAILASKKDVPLTGLPVPQAEQFTHDKFCLCPACSAKEAERIAAKAEKHLAETGHPLWCKCETCSNKRSDESKQAEREDRIRQGLDPEPPPPKSPPPRFTRPNKAPTTSPEPPSGLRPNPFASASSETPRITFLGKPPIKTIPHEPDCICHNCVRARGTGKKPT